MNPKVLASFAVMILIAFTFCPAGPATAQDTPAVAPPPQAPTPIKRVRQVEDSSMGAAPDAVTTTVSVQYLEMEMLHRFASTHGVDVFPDPSGDNVILSGPAQAIEKVREFMKLLDVPPAPKKNVLLTFYVITSGKEGPEQGLQLEPTVMDEIRNVLNTALGISQFSVWDTLFLRARDNDTAELSGFLPPIGEMAENSPGLISFKMRVENVEATLMGEEPSRIALDSLMLGIELEVGRNTGPGNQPRPVSRQSIGFESNLNIREGQMEIVDKTSISSKGDSIVVIVSAQVLKD